MTYTSESCAIRDVLDFPTLAWTFRLKLGKQREPLLAV